MSKWDALLAIHNFTEQKSLSDNAKIRSSLKFHVLWYINLDILSEIIRI